MNLGRCALSKLDDFLEERGKFEVPDSDVEWVRMLAQELALGVHRGLWPLTLDIWTGNDHNDVADQILNAFGQQRWKLADWSQTLERLSGTEFVSANPYSFTIARSAFDLLQEAAPYDIFISYRRIESSAFALLVSYRLKQHSLVPFVDMALEAGGNWHADLEERIKGCDYFIILLGKETLSSEMTVKEILWAIDSKRTIIPIWNSGFDIKDEKWKDIHSTVKAAIQQTNAIRVLDESASGYNTAIVQLLNRFGITP